MGFSSVPCVVLRDFPCVPCVVNALTPGAVSINVTELFTTLIDFHILNHFFSSLKLLSFYFYS